MFETTASAYERRAEECIRLASFTDDQILKTALLSLRQSYLGAAKGIKEHDVAAGATHSQKGGESSTTK
jgi:hypothetical protein